VQCKNSHAIIKERMREEDASYGGEMSAHYYCLRDFFCCDSGMMPWLSVAALILDIAKTLAELIYPRINAFPCSGEINYQVVDLAAMLQRV
jgi:phosphomannomutase/phosphoglucomutase